jgi:hypothetical protein
MKIMYRFTFLWSEDRGRQLESLGLTVEAPKGQGEHGIGVAYADEGMEGWSTACSLVREWEGGVRESTEFSEEEVELADYCVLRGLHYSGYPQPEADFAFAEATYQGYCSQCGTSLGQVAPFKVRKSLKWGRNSFLSLFWVVDQYFMPTAVWQAHLAPLGVLANPVHDTKGQVLDGIVQLKVDVRASLDLEDVRGEFCPACGREKFPAHNRGFYPSPISPPELPIFRTAQYFGHGRIGANEVVVRSDVASAITSAKMKGAYLWPCAPRHEGVGRRIEP